MSRKINVVPYNPEWIELFEKEKNLLEDYLNKDNILNVLHIGSTSVSGLSAKPIIDILLVVKNLELLDKDNDSMVHLDFVPKGEFGIKHRRYFTKGDDNRTHHIHAFQYDNLYDIERHLALRDYLRAHPDIAEKYGQIKLQAAKIYFDNSTEYSHFKHDFVTELEKSALFWYLSEKS